MRNLAFGVLLCAFTLNTQANDDLQAVKIVDFNEKYGEFSFIAEPIAPQQSWMDKRCMQIKVRGSYDTEKWQAFQQPMSKIAHKDALKIIKHAKGTEEIIQFGSFSAGLYEKEACNYISKGLMSQNGDVYSLYTNP